MEYLSHPSLTALWTTVRSHLERNSLAVSGGVTVVLDTAAADHLNGLVGASHRAWRPGRRRIGLVTLDDALRASAAQAGLVSVVAELTGTPLEDRPAARARQEQVRSRLWSELDAALARAGLADAPWVGEFVEGLRRSGLLTKAGGAAHRIVEETGAVLNELARSGALTPPDADIAATISPLVIVELGELATRTTGDAHGLDEGRATARLVLRAAAAALAVPAPATARDRRELWAVLGVSPDTVSGTVLTWGLRPPGDSPWASSMRLRADAGVVTHLTLQELRVAGVLPFASHPATQLVAERGARIWACENPQVMQAAARAGVGASLICTSGNPSIVAWQLLSLLASGGADVRYHGDFDWPGVGIAGRLYRLGLQPWRMGAADYEDAVEAQTVSDSLPLSGSVRATPWDDRLATAMHRRGVAVHEEALLELLLHDAVSSRVAPDP